MCMSTECIRDPALSMVGSGASLEKFLFSHNRWFKKYDVPGGIMAIEERCVPESLFQQCQYFILMHLDEFPVSHLSLLPLNTRKELLWQLPLADVCQLEGTSFTDGLDMAACWKFPSEEDEWIFYYCWWGLTDPNDKLCYVDELGVAEYKRAMLYGLLTACALGFTEIKYFNFYNSPLPKGGVSLLYAIRNPTPSRLSDQSDQSDHLFPSRYSRFADPGYKLTVDEVVRCFGRQKGELPKIFTGILYDDVDTDDVRFLCNVVCVSLLGFLLVDDGLEFLVALIEGATNLETLILDQWGEDDECFYLSDFCDTLSSQISFLSKLRQLTIRSTNSVRFPGFSVPRKSFNRLISAYSAAPTDHVQRLEFSLVRVDSRDDSIPESPVIDTHYLQFKTFKLEGCSFATLDGDYEVQDEHGVEPTSVSDWLGQPISILEAGKAGTCFFKVDNETSANPRKRTANAAEL